MHPALQGLLIIAIGVGACIGYFYFSNIVLDKLIFPQRHVTQAEARRKRVAAFVLAVVLIALWAWALLLPVFDGDASLFKIGFRAVLTLMGAYFLIRLVNFLFPNMELSAGDNINRAFMVRPWLFLFPAMFALGLYLTYPVFETLRLSLTDRDLGGAFVGLENYQKMSADPKFWEAMRNNALWLLVVPGLSTAFGLLVAQLTDRIRWGSVAKSIIFMPMAISFVGAAVIWKLVYDARPLGTEQIGILNALYLSLGGAEPQTWLTLPFWNNFFLMVVLIWIQTGFAMVILSAALRGVPEETIEAAIVDGANPFQIFFRIKIPQIMGTIVVVWTTITIVVLKIFDIVFAMTNGQWETQVLANYMYDKLFRANDWGVGSAAAMVIMLLVTPILVWNVYNARKEMK